MTKERDKTHAFGLSDKEIVDGLRNRDPLITRDYFYGFCRIAYHIYNMRYDLEAKEGMDFYSIAHEYYLALDKNDFRQLEDRKPGASLRTWMINGFRFVVLDRLKEYQQNRRMQSFEERMENAHVSFDIPDDNFSEDLRATIREICQYVLGRDSRSSIILQMMFIDGFKGREVAAQLGISPSAVTQKYHKLMEDVVIPYFKRYYVAPAFTEAPLCALDEQAPKMEETAPPLLSFIKQKLSNMNRDISKRITPPRISSLREGEIFVFGSNLAGMHGGGAARAARLYFGAVLGNGDGPQGQSYAIPTMQGGVETIRPYVDKFIDYAKAHPEQTFLVTPIGCGIAGFSPEEIAPLFRDAVGVDNIHLPKSFWNVLTGDRS